MSHDECGLEKTEERKPFDLYYYLNRASERVKDWSAEKQAAINYKWPSGEPSDHAETFDRIL